MLETAKKTVVGGAGWSCTILDMAEISSYDHTPQHLLNPSLREKKRHTRVCKGRAVEGWACTATPQAPVLFNTRALHAPLPWEGERWSVIFYSAGGVLHCTPVWRQQLLSMGFRVPNASSNPSS